MQQFTKDYLRKLRNLIPINRIIKEVLGIEFKHDGSLLRFLCPLCNEFQTGTNPDTNLAHCFICKQSFNPIDIVMIVKGLTFVETVKFLTPFLPNTSAIPSSPGTHDNRLDKRQNIRQTLASLEKRVGIR